MNEQFQKNLAALQSRMPRLARQLEGLAGSDVPELSAAAIPPAAIDKIIGSIAPNNNYAVPALIIGLDQGHLEEALQRVPCNNPMLPGHRPPIYLLCSTIERLRAVMHLRQWESLLADPRFFLFVGPDAARQFQAALRENPRLPLPQIPVPVDPRILPSGTNFENLLAPVKSGFGHDLAQAKLELQRIYGQVDRQELIRRFSSGGLRIIALTSRYTTFLKHSMRDWLSAMRKLGHDTRLLIEDADHELLNNLTHARACVEFRPDLILLIDHYRQEFSGLPTQIPAVMWIQDLLPHLFTRQAGAAQSADDYCLGYARMRCVSEAGYPECRFLPAIVGVNEQRFAPRSLSADERSQFDCDVCYVGHCSRSAEEIVREQAGQMSSPEGAALVWDIFERLRAIYLHGGMVGDPLHIEQLIRQSMVGLKLSMSDQDLNGMTDLFSHRVNSAMYRHQALQWLLELDLNIHLHGNGWEEHPTLARYARGVADNQKHLSAIYQAAKINLQITPHGLVHQRLFEGLCSGGFFLLRHRPGDVLERLHRPLWDWCQAHHVSNDLELKQKATPEVWVMIQRINRLRGLDMLKQPHELMTEVKLSADSNFTQSAGTLWGETYDEVAFASSNELIAKISKYLSDPDERKRISDKMRQVVLEQMTYTITSRRLLKFIEQDQLRTWQRPHQLAA